MRRFDDVPWEQVHQAYHKIFTGAHLPDTLLKLRRAPIFTLGARLFLRWWMSPEGQALNETVKLKGNPAPGSGTSQSKILETYKIPVTSTTIWTLENETRLQKFIRQP